MEDFKKIDHDLRQEFVKLNKPAKYGTAGFRDLATNIPYVLIAFIIDCIQSWSVRCHFK